MLQALKPSLELQTHYMYLIGLLQLSQPSNNMSLDVSVLNVPLYAVIFSSVVVAVGALAVLDVVMVRFCDSCDLKRLSTRFDVWCSRRCRCCPSVMSNLDGNDRFFRGRRLSFVWMVHACRCYRSLDVE